jgi:hypothetical protein
MITTSSSKEYVDTFPNFSHYVSPCFMTVPFTLAILVHDLHTMDSDPPLGAASHGCRPFQCHIFSPICDAIIPSVVCGTRYIDSILVHSPQQLVASPTSRPWFCEPEQCSCSKFKPSRSTRVSPASLSKQLYVYALEVRHGRSMSLPAWLLQPSFRTLARIMVYITSTIWSFKLGPSRAS